ncbi:MAG: alpha/beta fold hydrolase [Actinomycetota bacterium]
MRVMSSDHVSVALHDLGGSGRRLLFSHATGFHGYCYLPIADRLAARFDSWAFDHRGHGSTPRDRTGGVDWEKYGDDALAVARSLTADREGSGREHGLVAFGHSMGGASLIMAAERDPDLFAAVIAFEPIVIPPLPETSALDGPLPIAEAARRRRPSFESFDAALANYASKPPMSSFDPDVLRLYVGHGFGPAPEGVRLKCDPEHEALTFEGGHGHATFERLGQIDTPIAVLYGDDEMGPARFAPAVAAGLANGLDVHVEGVDHFAPYVVPDRMAELIVSLSESLTT